MYARDGRLGGTGGTGAAVARAVTGTGAHRVIDDFDTLPASTVIRILILLSWIGIGYFDTFDIHRIVLRRWDRSYSPSPTLCP